jgi:hypothetical protein
MIVIDELAQPSAQRPAMPRKEPEMTEGKNAAGADDLAMAEGQAAVEAIVETEAAADQAGVDRAATGETTPRRRRRPKTDKVAGADPVSSAADAAGTVDAQELASDAEPPSTTNLVPVMAMEEMVRADSVSITQGGAVHVEAGTLNVTQGGVQDARAQRIEVRQGGVGRAEVDELVVTQGGVGLVRAETASIRQGGAGAIIGDRVDVHQSLVRLVLGRQSVTIERGVARTVMARDVEIGERGFAGLVIARTVNGEGRILLDWRAGLAFGATFALLWALLRGRAR